MSPTLAPAIEFSDIVDPTRVPVLWMLIAFVVTALLTRGITRHIRAGEGKADPVSVADPHADPYAASTGADAPLPDAGEKAGGGGLIKNVHIGGVHVHHQVWGILLALLAPRFGEKAGAWWLGALLFGAVAPTLVAWFVVLPLKGRPPGGGFAWPGIVVGPIVNGAWGLGAACLLAVLGAARPGPAPGRGATRP